MTPRELAALHRAAFTNDRPWSETEFSDLLGNPHVAQFPHQHGFALARSIVDETELLTLAVDPGHQRRGIGRTLAQAWLAAQPSGTREAFLEVAADNTGAIRLYHTLGFREVGRRRAYYGRKDGPPADAIVMQRDLTLGNQVVSAPPS